MFSLLFCHTSGPIQSEMRIDWSYSPRSPGRLPRSASFRSEAARLELFFPRILCYVWSFHKKSRQASHPPIIHTSSQGKRTASFLTSVRLLLYFLISSLGGFRLSSLLTLVMPPLKKFILRFPVNLLRTRF